MMADSQEALRRSGAGCREPAVSRDLQSSRVHARVRGNYPPFPPAPAQFPRHWLDSWAWTKLEPLRSCGNGKHLALTPPWAILKALRSFRHQRGWWNEFFLINSQNIFMDKPKMRVKRMNGFGRRLDCEHPIQEEENEDLKAMVSSSPEKAIASRHFEDRTIQELHATHQFWTEGLEC